MLHLKPVRLHRLLGYHAEWTDELWDEALTYVADNTATPDVFIMMQVLADPIVRSQHKIDYLRQFRRYPPTLLLGAYDLVRLRRQQRSANRNDRLR